MKMLLSLMRPNAINTARLTLAGALASVILAVAAPVRAQTSCPVDRQLGVMFEACQVGTQLQIIDHNSNGYAVSIKATVTFTSGGQTFTRQFSDALSAYGGGQVALINLVGTGDAAAFVSLVDVEQSQ